MIMNANPNGRKKVEDGFYCWRSNADKVDPNRNWSYNFKKGEKEDIEFDSYGGEKPLTAIETITMDREIKKFTPDVFLDVHSGMKGLLYPWASEKSDPIKEVKSVKESIETLSNVID